MDKLLCTSCGAPLTPDAAQPYITCAYCDTAAPNPYYDETAAAKAAAPTLDERCVEELKRMGQSASLDESCFGTPLERASDLRRTMEIPDREKVYVGFDRLNLLGMLTEGFALTDTGLYYLCEGGTGRWTWEQFVTAPISCTQPAGWQQECTLSLGASLRFNLSGRADYQLGCFLIDFHNHMYQQHTGLAAPTAWTEESAAQEESAAPSLGKAVLTAAGALLARSAVKQTVSHRGTNLFSARRPAPPRPAVRRADPPRPLRPEPRPVQRPMHMDHPARPSRPGSGMRGPRVQHSPGRPGGMRGPGGPGRR